MDKINSFWDRALAFGEGALIGALIIAGLAAGLSVPILETAIETIGWIYAGTTVLSFIGSTVYGIATGNWSRLRNAARLFAGNFYLDGNRSFIGRLWQGLSRFSWELPQSTLGYVFSQMRNAFAGVDRVDYFGGVTFVTNQNTRNRQGISIGNFINISIWDEIEGSFSDRVASDPLFMHEYGHAFDSQIFGFLYLLAVGIPSLISAIRASQVQNEPEGVFTHGFKRYEMSANRHAARYFGKNYDVDWNRPYKSDVLETYYPRKRR